MCKPGSACCGCDASSSVIGAALAVFVILGTLSMAAALINDILTAVLIGVFSIAAAGTITLVVILRRTRGVVTWPPPAMRRADARLITASARAVPPRGARPVMGRLVGRPAAPTRPAEPALTAPQPLAIEAPVPAPLPIVGYAGLPAPARQVPGATRPGPEHSQHAAKPARSGAGRPA